MIRLRCVKCQTPLELDDAFAGGTCRCSHCGTIQTVPRGGSGGAARSPNGPSPKPKAIYQHRGQRRDEAAGRSPPPASPSGLDQLADAVAGSGLSGSGLSGVSSYLPPQTPQQKRRSRLIVLISTLGGLLVAGVIVAMLLRSPATPARPADATPATPSPTTVQRPFSSGPAFADLPLPGKTVVYILDKGDASREYFALLKELTLRSAATLGPDQQFLILFWDNGERDADLPTRPLAATPEAVASVRGPVEKVVAIGQSSLAPALSAAMAFQPDEIVLATAKGWQLDESFVDQALSLRGGSDTRVHTVALGSGQTVLTELAKRTGGQSRELTLRELRELLQ